MVTRIASSNRTRFRPQAEPSETDLTALRATVLTQAAIAAYAAGTLAAAQVVLGTAVPSLTTSVSLAAPFTDVSSAAPALSGAQAVTVPTGNPGKIHIETDGAGASYSINGAAFVALSSTGGVVTVPNGQTLELRRALAGAITFTLRDNTTGALINDPFELEAT